MPSLIRLLVPIYGEKGGGSARSSAAPRHHKHGGGGDERKKKNGSSGSGKGGENKKPKLANCKFCGEKHTHCEKREQFKKAGACFNCGSRAHMLDKCSKAKRQPSKIPSISSVQSSSTERTPELAYLYDLLASIAPDNICNLSLASVDLSEYSTESRQDSQKYEAVLNTTLAKSLLSQSNSPFDFVVHEGSVMLAATLQGTGLPSTKRSVSVLLDPGNKASFCVIRRSVAESLPTRTVAPRSVTGVGTGSTVVSQAVAATLFLQGVNPKKVTERRTLALDLDCRVMSDASLNYDVIVSREMS